MLIAVGHEPGTRRGRYFEASFSIFPNRRNIFIFRRSSGLGPIVVEFKICGVVASLCRVFQSWNRVTFSFSGQRVLAARHPHSQEISRALSCLDGSAFYRMAPYHVIPLHD
jgi:hypothetical protein